MTKKSEHKLHKHHKKKEKRYNLTTILAIILGVILLVNIIFIINLDSVVKDKIREGTGALSPPQLQLLVLQNSECTDCFDISTIVQDIKNANVNVTEEKTIEFSSNEAKTLIGKYSLEKLPTVIVTGQINRTSIPFLAEREDALVLEDIDPPFTDARTGDVKGRVSATYIIETSCSECNDPSAIVAQFKSGGVAVIAENQLNADSSVGRKLISQYNIRTLPTVLLSEDLSAYKDITDNWNLFGSVEDDGTYVVRTIQAIGIPYYDVREQSVKGLVDIVYLTDKSCDECYDVTVHSTILTRSFAIKFGDEKTIDISDEEGKALIEKYNITNVPTIVMSDDADSYARLKPVWAGVGTIEDDGTYIFRNILAMRGSVFKDLSTGEILGQ